MSHIDTVASKSTAFTAHDLSRMAARLIARHGAAASEIAEYFAAEHRILGDQGRALAWQSVRSLVADILSGQDFVENPTMH